MARTLIPLAALIFMCIALVTSQQSPPPLEDILTPAPFPNPNQAFLLLFRPSIQYTLSPDSDSHPLCYVVVWTAGLYDVQAACSAVSLSFLGTRDKMPPRFCKSRLSLAIIRSQLTYRLLISPSTQTKGGPMEDSSLKTVSILLIRQLTQRQTSDGLMSPQIASSSILEWMAGTLMVILRKPITESSNKILQSTYPRMTQLSAPINLRSSQVAATHGKCGQTR